MKSSRHAKIIDLINHNVIETQEELAERLLDAGFKVTQATISRDIKDLRLMKMPVGGGKQQYVVIKSSGEDLLGKYRRILKAGFVSMEQAQNIMVIKSVSGMAMAVAAAIDSLEWNEVVGCIAGDDTVFCALKHSDDFLVISARLEKIVNRD